MAPVSRSRLRLTRPPSASTAGACRRPRLPSAMRRRTRRVSPGASVIRRSISRASLVDFSLIRSSEKCCAVRREISSRNDCHVVVVRRELADHRLQDDERARQQEELAGIVDPVPAAGAQQRVERLPDRHVRRVAPVDFGEHGLDVHQQRGTVDLFAPERRHLEVRLLGGPRVAAHDRLEQERQRFAHRLVEFARHPEIEQAQPPVGQHEHVARMGVGVEQPSSKIVCSISRTRVAINRGIASGCCLA